MFLYILTFLRRHPEIVERTSEAVTEASSCVSEENIRKWFDEVQEYIRENNLEKFMNDPSGYLMETKLCFRYVHLQVVSCQRRGQKM